MIVLGLTHPISWNPAAALIENGKIVAAAEEERFVRIKHAPRMIPQNAIDFVLKKGVKKESDVDTIAISWDAPNTEDLQSTIKKSEFLGGSIQGNEQSFWSESFQKEESLLTYLKKRFQKSKIVFVRHHLAHAASVCLISGFKESLFLTIDGRGEFESGLIGIYKNGEFEILKSFRLDESLGHFYSCFTSITGFRAHTDEGKVMGLAPYGHTIAELEDVVKVLDDFKISIDWNKINSFFGTVKTTNDPTKDIRKDLAATAQHLLENCALNLISNLKKVTNISNLCLAGGSALNIDMNGGILQSQLIKKIFIQPASHDAGGALGAALYVSHQYSKTDGNEMKHAYLGPSYNTDEVQEFLELKRINYLQLENVSKEVAELLSKNKVVGWMQGSLEFGPRALGARSLLANPTDPKMWSIVNKIKGREYWRPLAPSILEEELENYCECYENKSPFMLLKFRVNDDKIENIPAVVHVDKSARPQSVSKETNPLYWNLIKEFQIITGVPLVINTSLNLKGEPIVNSPQDAIKTFNDSKMDYLCIGSFLLSK